MIEYAPLAMIGLLLLILFYFWYVEYRKIKDSDEDEDDDSDDTDLDDVCMICGSPIDDPTDECDRCGWSQPS